MSFKLAVQVISVDLVGLLLQHDKTSTRYSRFESQSANHKYPRTPLNPEPLNPRCGTVLSIARAMCLHCALVAEDIMASSRDDLKLKGKHGKTSQATLDRV